MKVYIGDIAKIPAASTRFEGEIPREDLGDRLEGCGVHGSICIAGNAVNCGDGVIELTADVETTLDMQCARCLEPVRVPLEVSMTEHFVTSDIPDEEVYVYDGEFLNIDDAVIDNILVNMPMRALCSEECKGLCPVCGVNRNTTRCDCQSNAVDPRLSALKALINEEEV